MLAPSAELKGYFEGFAAKYGLHQYIQTSYQVTEASWDQVKGQWNITATNLQDGTTVHDQCHVLVHATGYLNKPAWPNSPGLDCFKGPKLHSASWDESVSLESKKVILVGSGATAVQILPSIQPIVNRAKVFVRTPRWTIPSVNSRKGKFSPEEIERLKNDPGAVMALRKENERTLNSFFSKMMSVFV